MKKLAVLISEDLLPASANRRSDAHLFELEMELIASAARARGMEVRPVWWRSPDEAFAGVSAVLALCAWDYQDNQDAFLDRLARFEADGVHVFNPVSMLRWNIRKTYLRDLELRGAPVAPAMFRDSPTASDAREAFEAFGCETLVIKRQVGAGARGQWVLGRTDPAPEGPLLDRPAIIQPFFPSIRTQGERSFIFIDGELSHAVLKLPAADDYRIQPRYGGSSRLFRPEPEEERAARSVIGALETTPLYARVDMVRPDERGWALMELELIEPMLFPVGADRLGGLMAAALERRLVG